MLLVVFNRHYKEEDIWKVFVPCCRAVSHLHKLGVIHRDLKPLNIFITVDNVVKVKISVCPNLLNSNVCILPDLDWRSWDWQNFE